MNCGSDFFSRENIRMNWKIYAWIGVQIFFGIINNIYFIFCIGGLGCWNLKIYEWIGRYTNELGFRIFFGRYTNELEDIRMNWGSDFFLEDIRMNWKIYAWIGVQINFFWNKHIYFIFSIGGLGFWNLKIYEWIGRYTNELGFRFFGGRYTNELEDIRMNWFIFELGFSFWNWNIYEWIGRYILARNELGHNLINKIN